MVHFHRQLTIQGVIQIFAEIAVISAVRDSARETQRARRFSANTCKRNKTDDVFRRRADASAAFSFFFFLLRRATHNNLIAPHLAIQEPAAVARRDIVI